MRPLLPLTLLLILLQTPASATLPPGAPTKRGEFAFHYATRYTAEELRWYGRFKVVVTGDFLPPDQVAQLHRAGCKLVAYEWTVALYLPPWKEAGAWERGVVRDHPNWLLNPDAPLFGGAGAADNPAYYYDPANAELRKWRVGHLLNAVSEHHYDGLFFDTTGFASVQSTAQETFKRRYPGGRYDAYVGLFLRDLKRTAPRVIVFTNQGYRNAADYLPYADYDLTESYMTSTGGPTGTVDVEGKGARTVTETLYHPWNDPDHPWDSVAHYCQVLINDPVRLHGYRSQICHLNYGEAQYVPAGRARPSSHGGPGVFRPALDRQALYYGFAAAALMGQSSFFQPPAGVPEDDVYFADLGRPLGATYNYDARSGIAWRVFRNGVVVVNGSGAGRRISFPAGSLPRGVTGLWDVYAGGPAPGFHKDRSLTIPAGFYPATRRTTPSGRVYLFLGGG
ncbi:MAG: hypothetical protein M3Y56_01010 [Armatimonadota bacterium]|nr:hypothetical protein [Armatimonadota bacterium]